jgi:hypothetical protein
MRYALVTTHRYDDLVADLAAGKCRTGLYQWAAAFHPSEPEKHILSWPELMAQGVDAYDVIHVNVVGGDLGLLPALRRMMRGSSTQLIANMDMAPGQWLQSCGSPLMSQNEMAAADIVFHVEDRGAEAMSMLLGRPVFTCPHPVNYEFIASSRSTEKDRCYAVMGENYDSQMMTPWLVLKDLGVPLAFLNFTREGYDADVGRTLFDLCIKSLPHPEYLKVLGGMMWAYEPRTMFSLGRNVVEAAILGVPVSGSDRSEAMRRCYPMTTHDPSDYGVGSTIARHLVEDSEFAYGVAANAMETARYYDLAPAKTRFLRMMEEPEHPVTEMTEKVAC